MKWNKTQIPIGINPANNDISSADAQTIINQSINEWNTYSPLRLGVTTSAPNVVTFSSDSRWFGPGVVAVTILNYAPENGIVTQGNIYLNQTELGQNRYFIFSNTPSQSTGGRIYLGDVVTHELGHMQGLSHSEVIDASMVYSAFRGQSTVAKDDKSGVRAAYSVPSFGSIYGKVQGGKNVGIFGAHVSAISVKSGKIAGSSFSNGDGSFIVAGLDLDDVYYLYIGPIKAISALPDYLLSAKTDFCPGSYVGSFFEGCGTANKGHPQPIALSAFAPSVNIGVATVRCNLRVGDSYLQKKNVSPYQGEYSYTSTTNAVGEVFVGYFPETLLNTSTFNSTSDDVIDIDLTQTSLTGGTSYFLDLKILTQGLGVPLELQVEINGPNGLITYNKTTDVTNGQLLYDFAIKYPLSSNPALNILTVTLKPRKISSSSYSLAFPSPEYFVDNRSFYFAMVSLGKTSGSYVIDKTKTVSLIEDNKLCLDAPLAYHVNENPVETSSLSSSGLATSSSAAVQGAQGGCARELHDETESTSFALTIVMGFLLTILSLVRFRKTT